MKWYYIINNKKENEGIQNFLFSKGYHWPCGGEIQRCKTFPHAILFNGMESDNKYLFFSTIDHIKKMKKFNSNWYDCKEFKLNRIGIEKIEV